MINWKAMLDGGGPKKFLLPGCILLLGVLLLLLPGKKQDSSAPEQPESTEFSLEDFTAELEQRLGDIQGAGEVRVLLTLESDGTYEYQQDKTQSQGSRHGPIPGGDGTLSKGRLRPAGDPVLSLPGVPGGGGSVLGGGESRGGACHEGGGVQSHGIGHGSDLRMSE